MLPFENIKYQHVERWDTEEVEYLKDIPELIAQPKIDGTNGVIVCELDWSYNCIDVQVASRNRYLTVEDDNEGFAKFVEDNRENFKRASEEIAKSFVTFDMLDPETIEVPYVILYGEFTKKGKFLVKPEFFHNFFVFDVVTLTNGYETKQYHDPIRFSEIFEKFGIERVPSYPISGTVLKEKGPEFLKEELKTFSRFLMQDQFETGEGFVIKSYSEHRNKYGRQTWAKILYDRPRSPADDLYNDVLENWFDLAFLDKEYIKYLETFSKETFNIQKFSNIVVREFIKEEIANVVFKKKMPVIDFSRLYKLLIHKANNYARSRLGLFKDSKEISE